MDKRVSTGLQIFEITLYALIYLAIALGNVTFLYNTSPAVSYLFLVLGVLIFLTGITASFMWGKVLDHYRTFGLYGIFSLLSFKSFEILLPNTGYSLFTILFLLFLTLYSSRGVLYFWLPALFLFWGGVYLEPLTTENVLAKISFVDQLIFSFFSIIIYLISASKIHLIKQDASREMKEEVLKSRAAIEAEYAAAQAAAQKEMEEKESTVFENLEDSFDVTGKELETITYFVERVFRPHSTLAFIYNPNSNTFVMSRAKSKSMFIANNVEISGGSGVVGEIAVTKRSFVGGRNTLYSKELGYYTGNEAIESLLAVPILGNKTKELLGALVIDSKEKNAYRDTQLDAMERFAQIAAALIINIRMRKKEEQNAARFQMFYESAQTFAGSLQSMEILTKVLQYVRSVGSISRATAVAYAPKSNQCRIFKVDSDTNEIVEGYTFKPSNSMIINALKASRIEHLSDYQKARQQSPIFIEGENLSNQIRSVMVVPLRKTGAEYQLAITVESYKPDYFTKELSHIISTVINNSASSYEKSMLYQQMEQLAKTDGLTKLCNHRTFQEYLHDNIMRCHRYQRDLSLLLMDIDHFKSFNDTYGHQIGDLVLQIIADVLRSSVRSTDLPARYGGEEFVVVLPETDVENGSMMAERIRAKVAETPIPTEKHGTLSVTVSVGCATLNLHATTQEQLIMCADAAMYTSKKSGRNRATVFAEGMKAEG